MRILVTGAAGQLGLDMKDELLNRNHEVIGLTHSDLDIADGQAVMERICEIAPDAVIHCAAWTAVDAAETEAARCMEANSTGTENIAKACGYFDCKLVYPSTDYVFGNNAPCPKRPSDTPDPLNIYGLSKYLGELAVAKYCPKAYIVRTSWVFGARGKNFIKTILKRSQTNDRLSVVCDQIGRPTYTRDLCRLLADMAEREKYGVYHACNTGRSVSWYDLAVETLRLSGAKSVIIEPVTAAEFASAAPRPSDSRLDTRKLSRQGFTQLPHWQDALERYLTELRGQ